MRPSPARRRIRVAVALAALGLTTMAGCHADTTSSPPETAATHPPQPTPAPPATINRTERDQLYAALADQVGLTGTNRACTLAALIDNSSLNANTHVETGELIAAAVDAADHCGAREELIAHLLDQQKTLTPDERTCVAGALASLPPDQFTDLVTAGADAGTLDRALAATCHLTPPTT
jgi:hypothetical protein